MRKIVRLAILVLPLVLPLVFPFPGVFGCGSTGGGNGSGDSDSVGTGSGVAITDTLTTLNSVLMVASTSLTVGSGSLDQHVHCSDGNQAAVTGTNDAGSEPGSGLFDISIVMNGCEGVNGSSGFGGTSAVGETRDFTGDFTGTAAGNGCSVSLEALGYSYSAPLDTITAPTSESVTGSISATCAETTGSAAVSCDFGGGVDAQSTSALTAACACTGDGCGS